MINKETIIRVLSLSLAATGFLLFVGSLAEVSAQGRDPFSKPGWARPLDPRRAAALAKRSGPPVNLGTPAIQQRIEYYKRLRETAAASGQPIPKVTSVLTLDEMAVTGIFRTPRGYAAMVEAVPIKLSYTIYPGEKFFDGQLVAVEENRLVFRKVTKISNGKFVSSVENKALRQYTDKEVVQGTAPTETSTASSDPAPQTAAPQAASSDGKPAAPVKIVSPLDEMNKQVETPAKTKSGKAVKVARSN
jgi:hypothetical protein